MVYEYVYINLQNVIHALRLTVFIHAGLKALCESTGPALIPVRLIDGTTSFKVTLSFARVNTISVYTSFEKTWTA